jgi:hypothetical protein
MAIRERWQHSGLPTNLLDRVRSPEPLRVRGPLGPSITYGIPTLGQWSASTAASVEIVLDPLTEMRGKFPHPRRMHEGQLGIVTPHAIQLSAVCSDAPHAPDGSGKSGTANSALLAPGWRWTQARLGGGVPWSEKLMTVHRSLRHPLTFFRTCELPHTSRLEPPVKSGHRNNRFGRLRPEVIRR